MSGVSAAEIGLAIAKDIKADMAIINEFEDRSIPLPLNSKRP